MTITGIRTFDHSLNITKEWLKDVEEEMSLSDQEQAFVVIRAFLQTLRDRLTVEEATDFAAQLPMLLQGVYYHDWTPRDKPEKISTKDEFLSILSERLMGDYPPEQSAKAVIKVIKKRISPGEIEDIKSVLPQELLELWS